MDKIYYFESCSTCKRILGELKLPDGITFQDIKKEAITEAQLDHMAALTGSYESLFSRRSRSYRKLGLHLESLTESAYKKHILQDYTFLKRPVILIKDQIFIGNSSKTQKELESFLASSNS